MTSWSTYPPDYRGLEISLIQAAIQAGECVAVLGLSGSGKSNLLGFLAQRIQGVPAKIFIDCNRLLEHSPAGFFHLVRQSLGETAPAPDELAALEASLQRRLAPPTAAVCLLFDRFDSLPSPFVAAISGSLRALRDTFKYQLTYLIAARRPLEPTSELAELFYAHTLWLGALSASDARWSAQGYARRRGLIWDEETLQRLVELSSGYPALLRAACEAHAAGVPLQLQTLSAHPAVQKRLEEFWSDEPSPGMLKASRLENIPLLRQPCRPEQKSPELTAKENLLLQYLRAHPNQVCTKDDLIQAVWPEDKVFMEGIRDDSLAQLVRRLRRKIEPDPVNPHHLHNVPGRGYRYSP